MNREQRRMLQRRYSQQERQLERLYGGEKVCVICGKTFTGLGHNPSPVVTPHSHVEDVDRRCCTECNGTKVEPARDELLRQGKSWDGYLEITKEELKEFIQNSPWPVIVKSREQEN